MLAVVVVALMAHPAWAVPPPRPYTSFEMQRQADAVQRCVEQDVEPVRIESSLSKDGRLEESVRVTNMSSRCLASLLGRDHQCTSQNTVRPIVSLSLNVDDRHRAWSANERTRLEEGIVQTLRALDDGVVIDGHQQSGSDASPADSAMTLRVRLNYRGSAVSQRDIDEWLQMPKVVHINISLVASGNESRLVALRTITARVRPRMRTGAIDGYSDDWRDTALSVIGDATREMLKPLACSTPVLRASMSSGKLWLEATGYEGLSEGRTLLLIPSVETSVAALWPIVKVSGSGAARDTRQLDLLRGDAESCLAGCRALPL